MFGIQEDRQKFFSFLFDKTLTLESLLENFANYHGIIYNDQRSLFIERVELDALHRGYTIEKQIVLDGEDTLNLDYFNRIGLKLSCSYLPETAFEFSVKPLLEKTHNQWTNFADGVPFRNALARRERPSLEGLCVRDKTLMVGPYQFALLNQDGSQDTSFSTRKFSKTIFDYEIGRCDHPIVLAQDLFDGGNFAHFLFDWIPRVATVLARYRADYQDAIFILGGIRGSFHEFIMTRLAERFSLDASAFLFPDKRSLLKLNNDILFFSDQKRHRMHPAHLAHPDTVELIRSIMLPTTSSSLSERRLFITRRDAKLRKIENELQLEVIASNLGFEVITMSEHTIEEQLEIFRDASIIVGPHGMGMTFSIACRPGAALVELFHPTLGTDAYAAMAAALGLNYHYITGTETDATTAAYIVDPIKFQLLLRNLV